MKNLMKWAVLVCLMITLVFTTAYAKEKNEGIGIITDNTIETISEYLGYHPLVVHEEENVIRILVRDGILTVVHTRKMLESDSQVIIDAGILNALTEAHSYPITGEDFYLDREAIDEFLYDFSFGWGGGLRQYASDVAEIYCGKLHTRLTEDNDGILVDHKSGEVLYSVEMAAQLAFDWEVNLPYYE